MLPNVILPNVTLPNLILSINFYCSIVIFIVQHILTLNLTFICIALLDIEIKAQGIHLSQRVWSIS